MSLDRSKMTPGQHPESDGSAPGEQMLGKGGVSSIHNDGANSAPETPSSAESARAPDSLRTEFLDINRKLRPEVDLFDAWCDSKPLGTVKAETSRLDPRGILLRVWLPTVAWLKFLLTRRIMMQVRIPMPVLGTQVSAIGWVAWAEAISGSDPSCTVGVYFQDLNIVDRERILRYSRITRGSGREGP